MDLSAQSTPVPATVLPTAVTTASPPDSTSGDLACGGSFYGDTTGANNDVGRPSGEHYYRLAVPATRPYVFSTCEGSSFDTRLRLFLGDHLEASSTEIANVDDACGLQSRIEMILEPGSYTVVVEGFGSSEGAHTRKRHASAALVTGTVCFRGIARTRRFLGTK